MCPDRRTVPTPLETNPPRHDNRYSPETLASDLDDLSGAAWSDKPQCAQDSQMLRGRGVTDPERPCHVAGAHLLPKKEVDDWHAGRVRDGTEEHRQISLDVGVFERRAGPCHRLRADTPFVAVPRC